MNQLNLNNLINYQNSKIMSRYSLDYPQSKMQAEDALKELMNYVWLCHKHKADKRLHPNDNTLNFSCVIHAEMKDIDNMWHTFLLFTKDYHDFCNNYLNGIFFHHEPIIGTDCHLVDKQYEQELTFYLSYIYDNLGEDTLIKWFGSL